MIYEFARLSDGALVEEAYPMAEAPEIGAVVDIGGEPCRRVPSRPNAAVETVYFTSLQLPQNYPYAKRFDANGCPQFASKKELTDCIDRANAHGENLTWKP